VILDQQQADERAEAIRALLVSPLTTREEDPELFRLLAIHREWLAGWFDRACGWGFHLDVTGGTARLAKRRADLDASRPAVRPTDGRPFDRTRYVLLLCACAELVGRPHTTISDLADAVGVACAADDELPAFDPADHRHRAAFTDVLRWLVDTRVVTITAGALDQYATGARDAVLEADVARLASLPTSTVAPSRVVASDLDGWLAALTAEPRYGDLDADDVPAEQRNRWARHTLLRAVLDDPAVDVEDLDPRVRDYLATPSGRQLVRDVVADTGMLLERHADVLVAVDETRQATDATFGDRSSTLAQAAGVVLSSLLTEDRAPGRRPLAVVERHLGDLLAADPGWARAYQDDTGGHRLAREVLAHLDAFGLARVAGDEVVARPAAARFAVTVTDARGAANGAAGEAPDDGGSAPPPADTPTLLDEDAP
jgi:uncharacterized protein (TIGR02678 family)